MVEYNEPSSSAYAIERSEAPPKKRTTARPKRSQVPLKASGTAEQWHLRLGHPGPEVIEHLPAEVEVLEPWTMPSTTEYKGYALAKAYNVISRRPALVPEKPFERISVDWFTFERSYNGITGYMIIKYNLTAIIIVVLGTRKDTIYPSITKLNTRVKRHYGLRIRQI